MSQDLDNAARFADVAAAQQARIAEVLQQATKESEAGIMQAGDALGNLVSVAQASNDRVGAQLKDVQDRHRVAIREASKAQSQLVEHYVAKARPLYDRQLKLLAEALTCLAEMDRSANNISEVSAATRILQLCTRVEIAHLDKAGSQFKSTIGEMQKLNDVTDELNATLHALAEDLRSLLPRLTDGARDLSRGVDRFQGTFNEGLDRLELETDRVASAATRAMDHAHQASQELTHASHDALSALQFQDRMIQDLQRIDSRLGELIVDIAHAGDDDEAHAAFKANIGDRMQAIDEDDPDAPLDDGDLLLF